jgi:hypothetical protein
MKLDLDLQRRKEARSGQGGGKGGDAFPGAITAGYATTVDD